MVWGGKSLSTSLQYTLASKRTSEYTNPEISPKNFFQSPRIIQKSSQLDGDWGAFYLGKP